MAIYNDTDQNFCLDEIHQGLNYFMQRTGRARWLASPADMERMKCCIGFWAEGVGFPTKITYRGLKRVIKAPTGGPDQSDPEKIQSWITTNVGFTYSRSKQG